jgi:hypothetical protein
MDAIVDGLVRAAMAPLDTSRLERDWADYIKRLDAALAKGGEQ